MGNIATLASDLVHEYNYPSRVKKLEEYNNDMWKAVWIGDGEVYCKKLLHEAHTLKNKYLRSAAYGFGVSAVAIGFLITDPFSNDLNISKTMEYASELFVIFAGLYHGIRSMYLAKKIKDEEYKIKKSIIKDYGVHDLLARRN